MRSPVPRRRPRGFTLVELMIVVAVVAILATIAYPSYAQYVIKSRRVAAQACMQEVAQFMERFYTSNLTYADAVIPQMQCQVDLASYYAIGLAGSSTDKRYTLQAVPTAVQRDARCATMTTDEVGAKGATGTDGPAGCW